MAKIESTFKNMVLTLFIITLIASLSLGGIYNLTKGPIALAEKAAQEAAIRQVIPGFDELKTFRVLPVNGADSLVFNQGIKDGNVVGTAVLSYSTQGYDPTPIKLMVGILPDGTISNTEVIQQKETPGLGTKMSLPEFKDQFMNINPKDFTLKVKKDGGQVDAITAATISSRAFCDAVERAYLTYENIKEESK
ncbi:MAG: RnfABCDGE type electron transport complex subunit G [Bacteroidetes bacterium]|nr:RnfABCDGE type electron transport complex subunit G [Bacteroidota bacterium]